MRRVPDSQRLEHRVTVNMTAAQWETLNAEANGQGLAPSVIARQAFVRGLELLQGEGEPVTSGEPVNGETGTPAENKRDGVEAETSGSRRALPSASAGSDGIERCRTSA